MSLYNDWKELVVYYVQTVGQQGFFEEYSRIQETAYPILLKEHNKPIEGKIKNLASELNLTPATFMGFLDSLNTSLIAPLDLEKLEEETEIELHVNYEKLFVNMVEIGAINLYTLSEWNLIFSRKELQDLIKSNGVEKTIVFPKEIGRNDACPCGSGKKFKNCCGKDK